MNVKTLEIDVPYIIDAVVLFTMGSAWLPIFKENTLLVLDSGFCMKSDNYAFLIWHFEKL